MRTVMVSKFIQVKVNKTRPTNNYGDTEWYETLETIKVDDYKAKFHVWSTNYEEFHNDQVGQYPVAIVEREDGIIETPAACLIRFILE